VRLGHAKINVGPKRVEWDPPVTIAFTTRHLSTTQAPGYLNANSLRAKSYPAPNRLLHRSAKGDALLKLFSDAPGDQISIELRLTNLLNGDANLLAGRALEGTAKLLDLYAALPNHDAGLSCVDCDRHLVGRALNLNLGDARIGQTPDNHPSDPEILVEILGECFPFGVPVSL
jgi:hypothetical protein